MIVSKSSLHTICIHLGSVEEGCAVHQWKEEKVLYLNILYKYLEENYIIYYDFLKVMRLFLVGVLL